MNSRSIAALLALLLVASAAPTAMAAGFEIAASDTTPVPERTVTFEGTSFSFDSIVRAGEGDGISVDVTAPDADTVYRLHVRNSDNQIVESPRGEGDGTFSVDLSGYDHGSYVFAVYHDGTYEKAQPLLVSGYDVSVEAPATVTGDEASDVTVNVSPTAASSGPASVTVVVAQGETTQEFAASGSDGAYTATLDGGELDDGEYTVYGVVQGDEEAFGRSELQGLSDGHTLTVDSGSSDADDSDSADSDGTDDSEPTDGDSTDDGASTNDSADDTPADSTATNESTATDEGGAANPPENESTETPTESTTATVTPTATESSTDTDDGVITPGEGTATESTGASGPGFTVAGAVLALALVVLFARRRA